MDKRGQLAFSPSDFSQGTNTVDVQNPNLPKRLLQGLLAAILLFVLSPIVVAISNAMEGYVCGNPTVCLFFKFIVPAYILGGIFGIIRYVWSEQ